MTHYGTSRNAAGGWEPPALEEIQAALPQYDITALLGRGGMGAVYKGWQRSLDRFVAIKVLPPGLTDDVQYAERFKQEAKSMARLSHPGIVAVFDAGELPDGMLYFVMEFIEGTDVQKMIAEQGSLPPAHAMAITAHVCDALRYAHDRGIIHRDVKPANIMVSYDGVVKVADFGLAKQQQGDATGLTQSGMVMGTLHYMAPEALILGTSVDHRADIYAAGVMLYQMLTGRLPQGLFEMPSLKVPGLDPRYDAVVAKAIREDREARYQSAAELRADLDSILTQPVVRVDPAATHAPAALPTVARPQRPQGMPRAAQQVPQPAPKKSSSLGLVAAGVVAVVLAAGAFVLFKGKDKGAPPPPAAGTPVAAAPKAEAAVTVAEVPAGKAAPSPATAAGSTKPPQPQPQPQAASRPPAMPAVVTMKAVPKTELEQRVAALESGFQTNAKGEPESTYRQSMAALDKSYLAAIDRALAAATKDARLEDAVALREERQRMEKGVVVPAAPEEAAATVPVRDAVKKLRDTYRITQQQHATTKGKAVAALYDKYDQALAALQADLTKAQKLDDALLVKPLREQIKARKEAALALKPMAAISLASLGITNSLGMRLVPVPGTEVLMCVHETRRQDFAVFAQETSHGDNAWKDARAKGHATASGHEDGHPVVGVTWEQAVAFCEWLSKREGLAYRLPSDWEWSMATGLSEPQSAQAGRTPKDLNGGVPNQYPWGSAWPPPPHAGNFLDLACWKDMAVPDFDKPEYDDGFPTTAPVMTFPPNNLGIFDLAGNVTEWCADWYDAGKTEHVSRGSAWYRKVDRGLLGASFREHSKVGFRNNGTGFRVVVKSPAASSPVASPVAAGAPVSTPAQVAVTASSTAKPIALQAQPFTNSLGMKFVLVPKTNILMCIHETRRQDYAAYADSTQGVDEGWKNATSAGGPVGHEPNHPVVSVNWDDANEFCRWLSGKEQRRYRLPSDLEWSTALGIADQENFSPDATPENRNGRLQHLYPWNGIFQIQTSDRAGNYADISYFNSFGKGPYFEQCQDGYPTTAPVMSFKPNDLGLYDMGGNVWEWVQDKWNNSKDERVSRGGSWVGCGHDIRSTARDARPAGHRYPSRGFRCVLEMPGSQVPATQPVAATTSRSTPAAPVIISRAPSVGAMPGATAQTLPAGGADGFTNSLGMKFVPVPGTQVLMCVHEARRQDYAAYAAESPGVDDFWRSQIRDGVVFNNLDNHPVVNLSFNDAQAFCDWLSKKEGKVYRLPSDKEWSHAVGIGRMEEAAGDSTPEMLSGKLDDQFPWGGSFPPQTGNLDGNYSDETSKEIYPGWQVVRGYKDGFANSAPVMSFRANSLGLYDLGGNAWEWVEDWYDKAHEWRCLRGASFYDYDFGKKMLHSSYRFPNKQTFRHNNFGFRPVLDLAPSPSRQVPASAMPNAAAPPAAVAGTPPASVGGVPEMVFFDTKGQVNVIGPDEKVTSGGVSFSKGAAVTSLVIFGSTVKTGVASSADLALSGGGSIRLEADTELKLSAPQNGRPAGDTLELIKGRLFLTVDAGDLAQKGVAELKLKTPAATLGIKGGKCHVEIGPKFETISMFKGVADVSESSAGGKMVLREDMGISVKPGALSPSQRLTSTQAALVKVCDDIELVRIEADMREVDTPADKAFEDTCYYPNTSEKTRLTECATLQRTTLPNRRTKGALMIIKPNDVPNAQHRTVSFEPQVEVPRAFSKVVAIENCYRGDGIVYLNTNMSVSTREGDASANALPSSVESDRVYCALGNGGMGDWRRNMFPLLGDVGGPGTKIIELGHSVYPGGKGMKIQSVAPGKSEYRLEMGPVVIIARKR